MTKSKSHLLTPQKSNNQNPSVAYAPEPGLKRKKKEIKGGLKVLSEKGSIRVTSYSERIG